MCKFQEHRRAMRILRMNWSTVVIQELRHYRGECNQRHRQRLQRILYLVYRPRQFQWGKRQIHRCTRHTAFIIFCRNTRVLNQRDIDHQVLQGIVVLLDQNEQSARRDFNSPARRYHQRNARIDPGDSKPSL